MHSFLHALHFVRAPPSVVELEKINRSTSSMRPKKVCSIKTLFTCHINLNHHFVQLVSRPVSFCERTTLLDEETKEEEKVPIQSIYDPTNPSIYSLLMYLHSGETCVRQGQCQASPWSGSSNVEEEDGRPGGAGGANEEDHPRLHEVTHLRWQTHIHSCSFC